jgi:methanol--5-hydroxybenzimidazolylcobamide Co-methyltransferase
MNEGIKAGNVPMHILQSLMVSSDIYTDPQALILAPENVITLSKELIKGDSYVANARNGALKALDLIEEAWSDGRMPLADNESAYLPLLRDELSAIPDSEDAFIEMMIPFLDASKFIPEEYGL